MQAGVDKDTADKDSADTCGATPCELLLLRQTLRADWSELSGAGRAMSAPALLAWWSRYKYVVLAHDQRTYRRIGPLLSDLSGDVTIRAEQVLEWVMNALATPASQRNHVNALQHVAGHVKKSLTENEKCQWQQALADYDAGLTPLQVPAALLHDHLQRYGSDYVRLQRYPGVFLHS